MTKSNRIDHIIPILYIRGFCRRNGKNLTVNVYDKKKEEYRINQNPNKILREEGIFEYKYKNEIGINSFGLDDTWIETPITPIIRNIMEGKKISVKNKLLLSAFIYDLKFRSDLNISHRERLINHQYDIRLYTEEFEKLFLDMTDNLSIISVRKLNHLCYKLLYKKDKLENFIKLIKVIKYKENIINNLDYFIINKKELLELYKICLTKSLTKTKPFEFSDLKLASQKIHNTLTIFNSEWEFLKTDCSLHFISSDAPVCLLHQNTPYFDKEKFSDGFVPLTNEILLTWKSSCKEEIILDDLNKILHIPYQKIPLQNLDIINDFIFEYSFENVIASSEKLLERYNK